MADFDPIIPMSELDTWKARGAGSTLYPDDGAGIYVVGGPTDIHVVGPVWPFNAPTLANTSWIDDTLVGDSQVEERGCGLTIMANPAGDTTVVGLVGTGAGTLGGVVHELAMSLPTVDIENTSSGDFVGLVVGGTDPEDAQGGGFYLLGLRFIQAAVPHWNLCFGHCNNPAGDATATWIVDLALPASSPLWFYLNYIEGGNLWTGYSLDGGMPITVWSGPVGSLPYIAGGGGLGWLMDTGSSPMAVRWYHYYSRSVDN